VFQDQGQQLCNPWRDDIDEYVGAEMERFLDAVGDPKLMISNPSRVWSCAPLEQRSLYSGISQTLIHVNDSRDAA
jgi:hypothetical protein